MPVPEHPPLVSCIAPTRDRRPFVARAIRYFRRQGYPRRELILVDDGADPIADLVPEDRRIRYLRAGRRLSVGAKRNLACAEARGSVILHWDDDDWMASWRIAYQVAQLERRRADVCGLAAVLHYDPVASRAWRYVYPAAGRPWVAGGTLCYRRELWRGNRFSDLDVGEDNAFLWSRRPKRLAVLQEERFYVALIHRRNTSRKHPAGRRWKPCDPLAVRNVMGRDWRFYAAMSRGDAAP